MKDRERDEIKAAFIWIKFIQPETEANLNRCIWNSLSLLFLFLFFVALHLWLWRIPSPSTLNKHQDSFPPRALTSPISQPAMAGHSMAALSHKELASPLSLTTLTQSSVSVSAPPACFFAYAPTTGRLGDASVSGSTTRSVLWGSGDAKRDACVWGFGASFGGRGFKSGEGSLVAKANPLDEMQGYVEKELRSYTSELHKRAVAGDDSLDSSSFTQEPRRSTPRSEEPTSGQSLYTRNERFLGSERKRSTSSEYDRDYSGAPEDDEENGVSGWRYSPKRELNTKRDVWVNPSGSFSRDARRQSERRESVNQVNKFVWVSPDRKSENGNATWPERRAAMVALQTGVDVAATLSIHGDRLETMDLNAVLRRYGRMKKWQEALTLFEWMKENDKLSAPTYTSFFSVLGKGGRVEKALHVFNDLPSDSDIRRNVYVCNSVLSTLVYNGKVDKAFRLFEQLKHEGLKPDIITYSTVIAGCAKTRDGFAKAKDFVEQMQRQSLTQDAVIYGALINVCASHGLEEEAKGTFEEMVEAGLTPNLFHYSALLNTFAGKGKHVEAEHVVDQIRSAGLIPNLVVYNSLMNAYSNSRMPDEARKIFEDIQAEGLQPDMVSYCSMMDAYAKSERVQEAHEIFNMMRANGIDPGSIGYSILILAYAKVGQLDGVERLVAELDQNKKGQCDILLFNTLLKAYCNAGYMDGVMVTLKKMDAEGCTPDRGTFNILIGYFAKEDLVDLALRTLQDMEARGHRPNEATYNALLQGLMKVGKVEDMWDTFSVMKKRGIMPTNLSLHTVITGLLNDDRVDDVLTTFEELKGRGRALVPGTMERLVEAFVKAGNMAEVKAALILMKDSGHMPSQGTWDIILLKYAELGLYPELLQLLEELKVAGVNASPSTYSELMKQVSNSTETVKIISDLTSPAPVP